MRAEILKALEEIEQKEQIKILYACESGSRAWGFASPDSDYDVRFIYARNIVDYLQIDEVRDVIEKPINDLLDIGGWDIKKALKLYRSANAALYEWFQSPIVYRCIDEFYEQIKGNMNEFYSLKSGFHHYLSMSSNIFNNELQANEVKLKRYFYVLRPLFAAKWIYNRQEVPPMEFSKLRTVIDNTEMQNKIDDLLLIKKKSDERALINPIGELQELIQSMLTELEAAANKIVHSKGETDKLNLIFRKFVNGL